MNERLSEMLECDVCVIGGGPAGSAFAGRLARLGYGLILIEKQRFAPPYAGESLPPAILPLLQVIGVGQAVEGASFLRPRRARVLWPGEDGPDYGRSSQAPEQPASSGERTTHVEALGFQVDRGSFDLLLLQEARRAGVRVFQPAQPVLPLEPPSISLAADSGHAVEVLVRTQARQVRVRCRFVADASGRAGVLGGIKERSGPPTAALSAYWHDTPLQGDETRLEARSDRWYRGTPLSDGSFRACVFLDPRHMAELALDCRESADGLENDASNREVMTRVYAELLKRSQLLSPSLQGELLREVEICDTTTEADLDPINDYWIKLGEAAFSIDPLPSQGVQTAIRGGLEGASAIHTILSSPNNARQARRLYRDRCRAMADDHHQLSARYARRCLPTWNTPFWRSRARSLPAEAEFGKAPRTGDGDLKFAADPDRSSS